MTPRPPSPATVALAAAGVLAFVAGCSLAVEPAPPRSPESGGVGSPTAVPSASPSTALEPDLSSLVDLGLELEIDVLDREHTEQLIEFASDGQAVLFSSGGAAAGTQGAPDLWRVAPGQDPELVWENPNRDHSLALLGGDLGTYAFVDMPLTGARDWTLYVLPRRAEEAIVLDRHPGSDVSSLVPSFSIYEGRIVWTAFDDGERGPVSQLLTAAEPRWEPEVLLEVPAAEAELWLPSLYGGELAFTEVRYSADRQSDERSVWLMSINDPGGRRRLDTTGRATMPIRVGDAVFWKQAERGYNMFNWGHMYRHDLATGEVSILDMAPQTFVNYPSGGERWLAWWGSDAFQFGVYDHLTDTPRIIESNPAGSEANVIRPHLHSDLLAWLRVTGPAGETTGELRYAFLPSVAELRGVKP